MPPRRSTRAVSGTVPPPPPAEKRPAARTSRSRKTVLPSPSPSDDEGFPGEGSDEEEPRPKRGPTKVVVEGEEEDASDSEFGTAPAGRTASVKSSTTYHSLPTPPPDSSVTGSPRSELFGSPRSVASGSRTPTTATTKELPAEEDEEDDEDDGDRTIRAVSATPSIPDDLLPPRTPSQRPPPTTPGPASAPAAPPAPSGPKPRLTIHKIVLVNFKSYAGRQEIGPFHKSFSAIVGPNGSGKSNTIDALLFVFGYRASKMRQGKLSELIHNSAGKEGLESCSVEVWFREIVDLPGVNDFLLVPNSQLVVTRTAFRNNSSRYSVNNSSSSFTEVTTLLKGKGIDLDHNRFLILQGEVESIALMKAKATNEHEDGLLEYLEDIIGTTKYKMPIEDASGEVETLNEQRGEKMNRLRVVEREKASLEDKKIEAEAYLRDMNNLTRKKSLLWQFHMYTLQNNIEITTKAIESLNAQLIEEQERNAGQLAEIDHLQKGYDEKLAAFDEVKRLTDALVKDSKKFEKEEVGLQEKKKHLTTKQKKIKKSIADDGHVKAEAQSTVKNCEAELETNRAKVTDLEAKLEAEEDELEQIRDSLKDKTDQFTTQIEVKQRELEPWTTKISEKQSAIDVAQSERDLLAQKATGAKDALDEAAADVEKTRQGDQAKKDAYDALKKEGAAAKKQLVKAEAKAEALAKQGEQMRAKVSSARHKVDEAKASLAADKSENAVLGSLNKLKAQGRIKGFHGRLGDLGVIDDKYDVAVTTACSALNNLIVDTVEQGQACIEHLRKGNVGRASFMVLEKLPPRDLNPIETPENVPRLFDLIKPKDPRFAPAFYKGLFNTLVAADLEQAQRIGYGKKRWRVVTLAGQLIDPSGTMSGGGAKVARGGMSSKFAADRVAPEVVARYEQDTAAAERELAELQAEKRDVDAEVAWLRKRVPEIEIEVEKVEMDVQTGARRIAEAEKRLAELRAQSKPDAADERRIVTLDGEVAALTREADKLREKAGAINDAIRELQNKILEVGGVKLRAIQSKVATTKGLLDLANEAITKAEVGQAKAARDADKAAKAIESNQAKMEEVEAELEVVESDLQACSADLATIREKVQEAQDASADVQEALAASKAELDEKSTDINAFRALEMDIKQKIEDNGRAQKDSKDKYRHWKKRHEELELVYVDEEDEEEEAEAAKPVDGEASGEAAEGEGELEVEEAAEEPKKKAKHDSLELVEYSPDELQDVDKDILNGEITQLEEETAKAKPNLNVLAEYRKREAEFLDRAKDLEAVTSARDRAKQRYDELRKVRLDEFMAGFSAISAKLKEMYQMITMGGNAEIELIDTMDPFSEGVVLSIMPPKKSWRPIANLSGGEKTLASLALVFALHVFKPTPLYFMDEIDAALDFKNVSIVANYIQSKTQAAQFIVISLRNDMFELAHRLVGIYKTSNCTKSIAIDNKDLRTQAVPRARPASAHPHSGDLRTPAPSEKRTPVPGTARVTA
ncbi:Structural maintenance of chromosomes protein 4 [Cryptotrichosporon argae]